MATNRWPMPFTKLYLLQKSLCVRFLSSVLRTFTKNITVAGGVNWVGVNNGYTQAIDGSAVLSTLSFRKVSTPSVNPLEGRGQSFIGFQTRASGMNVFNQNLSTGTANGSGSNKKSRPYFGFKANAPGAINQTPAIQRWVSRNFSTPILATIAIPQQHKGCVFSSSITGGEVGTVTSVMAGSITNNL